MAKIIVGLGNPGESHKNTRHNIGFVVLDKLESEISNLPVNTNFRFEKKFDAEICKLGDFILTKPQTFMNNSGVSVKKITSFYNVNTENIWVIHDDLDIKLGEYKIQKGIGPKLHYGISSIENELKTINFWRVRIGVDNREEENRTSGEEYVLQNFTVGEITMLEQVIKRVVDDIKNRLFS